ncbi:protein tyrosine phosphatase family protein [Nostoc sp. FACHB-87]|uniref:beta-lactamase hydrolase domain-containing protein n=1 Tax=Nostocaceae TaxID=1162 RepID=UPI0016887BA9|nr:MULTISPECIES: sulfur transferase domain-containing protein [Nostocaceae]MBD2297435.1 protein tyrosine phosphatase family protein [Nostoc sp. FACHB-190]MBD2452727.1 protein tyrosine phosphatase family protein [Nostoc sp. FACHB-87]MBD2473658.1 protein tyrosine phosphatase family protein [Anabaena sp. FACHB-83]
MNNAILINDSLTTTGQISVKQLEQAIQEGYKSVLNLRSPDELGFFRDEQKLAEKLGLYYVNVPVKLEALNEELITQTLKTLEQLPKPVLIHCAAGMRSTGIALLSIAIKEGLNAEQTLAKAKSLGFGFLEDFNGFSVSPRLKQLFVNYVNKHAKVAVLAR